MTTLHACPECGEPLEHRRGDYVFHWPVRVGSDAITVFPQAQWDECTACGERVLSLELDNRIEQEQYRQSWLAECRMGIL